MIRKKCPHGVTITEFVKKRYGKVCHAFVGVMVVFYMSIFYISELTALGSTVSATYKIDSVLPICFTVLVTTIYTAYGGLPASMLTDRFQGWSIIILIAIASIASFVMVDINTDLIEPSGLLKPTRIAWESFYVLSAAMISSNLFHQGYWQRVYSAKSNKDILIGILIASGLIIVTFSVLGLFGVIAIWGGLCCQNEVEYNNVFFSITSNLPSWINVLVLILATALVCSSTDTIQIGLTATIVNDVFNNKISVNIARACVIVLSIPIVILASKNADIMRLFLIADLYSAIVGVVVLIAFIDRLKRYKKPVISTKTSESTLEKPILDVVIDECDLSENRIYNNEKSKESLENIDNKSISINEKKEIEKEKEEERGEERVFYVQGSDVVFGMAIGIISIVLFGWGFHKSFKKGLELLLLPDGMSVEGESLGAFLAAPFGTLLGIFVAASIRTLVRQTILNKFKKNY